MLNFIFMIVFKTHPSVRHRYMAVQLLGWRVAWMLLMLSFKLHRVISKFPSNRIPLPFLFIFLSLFSCPLCHNTQARFVETQKHAEGLQRQVSFSFLNVWGCSPLGSRKRRPVPSLKNCFRALPTFWRSPVTIYMLLRLYFSIYINFFQVYTFRYYYKIGIEEQSV